MNIKVDNKKIKSRRTTFIILITVITCLLFTTLTSTLVIGLFVIKSRYSIENTINLDEEDLVSYESTHKYKEIFINTDYENLNMKLKLRGLWYKVEDLEGNILESNDYESNSNDKFSEVNISFNSSPIGCGLDDVTNLYFYKVLKDKKEVGLTYNKTLRNHLGYKHYFTYTNLDNERVTLNVIRRIFSKYIYEVLSEIYMVSEERLVINSIYNHMKKSHFLCTDEEKEN